MYAGALRILQDLLGADSALTVLDQTRTAEQLAGWFHGRYGQAAPATRVRQIAILRSACTFWRRQVWISTDQTADLERPKVAVDRTRALTRDQLVSLLAGRTTGQVFLADRQPTLAVPSIDRCPVTGRARLSYRRTAELFGESTNGWTLHQLRHSALTHAAEDGTNTAILLARSRHASVRSLERYARPCSEAVARHVAAHDPARRRR